jgi:hypothetical protein
MPKKSVTRGSTEAAIEIAEAGTNISHVLSFLGIFSFWSYM